LKVVTAVNFINFSKTLQTIHLFKKKLKEIPSDLFTYAPNLHSIALDRNMIQHVGNHFFDHLNLNKLERFTMKLNTKFPGIVNGDLKLFEQLRVELLKNCKPTDKMIREEERNLSDSRFDYLKWINSSSCSERTVCGGSMETTLWRVLMENFKAKLQTTLN
jgi:hypothetical protein